MTSAYCNDVVSIKQTKKPRAKKLKDKQYTTTYFIERAIAVHGQTYDYSKSIYTAALKTLLIICPTHGSFEQIASKHLMGRGCSKCARSKVVKKVSEFIVEAKAIHANNYTYDKAVYVNNATKLVITCNSCKSDFNQTPASHLVGKGCPKCNKGCVRKTNDQFIAEAIQKHGDRYKYDRVDYKSNHAKIWIGCEQHGYFEQSPWNHISGSGCYDCGLKVLGFSKDTFKKQCEKNNNGNGFLYVLKCVKGKECFYKVGITSRSLAARFSSITIMPYEYSVEYLIEDDGFIVYELESSIHRLLIDSSHKPKISFSGSTECFSDIKKVRNLLATLSKTKQCQLIA